MASSSSFTCTGCGKTYNRSNHLIQHWLKSTAPKCLVASEAHQQSLRLDSSNGPRQNRSVPSVRSRSPSPDNREMSASFEGDFFGSDYDEKDFPGFDTNNGDFEGFASDDMLKEQSAGETSDHTSDDGEEEDGNGDDLLALEQQWEPVRLGLGTVFNSEANDDTGGRANHDADMDIDSGADLPGTPDLHTPDLSVSDDVVAGVSTAAPQLGAAESPAQPFYVDKFGGKAGARLSEPEEYADKFSHYREKISGALDNPWAPFNSQMDWEVARWAKLRGLGSTAFSDLLRIDGVLEALGLSYANSSQLNQIIDSEVPTTRPSFTREEVVIAGQSFDLFKRDIIECIRALYGDPDHSQYLCIVPERHYADADKTVCLYHDFHSGRWWWGTQRALEEDKPGATIIPVILSSDKTQVTLFRNKSAYPVYLTIGNLPKEIRRKPSRRGQILLAYLPTTRLEHIKNRAARRRTIANLFHACMANIVKPLKSAGLDGIVMISGDGSKRRCHPIFAAYVGDYPEQVLVTCTYTGDSPVCECPADELGEYPCRYQYRDYNSALQALSEIGTTTWAKSCLDANIKPVQHPFWEDLPYVDIFRAITPDILHQLLQGVMKHLIGWVIDICGADEIDARVRRLPPGHGMRIFYKGISTLSRVSGTEHKQIYSFLLGIITDITLPDRQLGASFLSATRALLDFLSLARYPIHSDQTLDTLEAALATFHANKHVFISLGVRDNFNFPKLHFLAHYIRAIKFYGTTDNYNTEATERLHIDFAKDAYASTNRKDEFLQMTKWLERREKIMYHTNYILWQQSLASKSSTYAPSQKPPLQVSRSTPQSRLSSAGRPTQVLQSSLAQLQQSELSLEPPITMASVYRKLSDMKCLYEQKMTRFPTVKYVPLAKIQNRDTGYGATLFKAALARFVARYRHPDFSANEIEEVSHDIILPFRSIPVFHKIKFLNPPIFGNETQDTVHAFPQRHNARKILQAARFDTALIKVRDVTAGNTLDGDRSGLQGMRLGRVRVIFSLPKNTINQLFPINVIPPEHLAYVEWFTKFSAHPEAHTKMYKVKREITSSGTPLVTVLPVELIQRSVFLFPKWGGAVPVDWTSDNVLDRSPAFFMSPFRDIHTYYELAD